jgi:cytochrome c oxidase subunit 1
MTIAPAPIVSRATGVPRADKGSRLLGLLRTTDHKTIGLMHLATALMWFVVGGVMAMLIRGELARPGLQFLSPEQYNQIFTMHGTIMLFFFATPMFFAFANLIMPLQIGAPDVAFPRLNAFSYWLFVFGSLVAVAGFLTPAGPRTSGGPPTRRGPIWRTARAPAPTCGSSGSPSVVWARSSLPSTSSRRSSASGLPA